ncbi:MAG: hypothetical protein A2046_12065 [Bacteroidetes bacterium GWA2_30_7]|nr:MAG: hypothetical protein A2046_12065 [Bacteroidetes bacterium GWA2_30_7]
MKPIKTSIFILIVLFLLSALSFVFPKDGLKIKNIGTLRFASFEEVFSLKKTHYADISAIINSAELKVDTTTLLSIDTTSIATDSLLANVQKSDSSENLANSIIIDSNIKIHNIEYPENANDILYGFFKNLSSAQKSKEPVRILHYGDSQIEGDRISSYIRYKLQKQFGGTGIGFLPAFQIYNYSVSMKQTASDNWKRFTVLDKAKAGIENKKFGIMSLFSRFNDLNSNDSTVHEAWLKFEKSKSTYNTNRKFVKCKMYYGFNNSPLIAELYQGENLKNVKTIMSSDKLEQIIWDLDNNFDDVTIKFSGKDSPNFYGFSFEDNNGILVDNFALRGSSGLEFTKNDLQFQKDMSSKLNTGLIILQYGINIVTGNSKDYSYYENWYYNQIKTVQKIYPNAAIIVIGVSDMSRKVEEVYESYPTIEQIRDAQKNAAFKAKCGFWDLYQAMGGQNSMPSWVNHQPTLAAKDYTHFSYEGAKKVAEMFYNSLIFDYNQFVKRKSS